MTSIVPFEFKHLFQYNAVNVDRLTETYSLTFYGNYLNKWTEYQRVALHGPTQVLIGYMLGKVEGDGEDWHGHVSAVTVAPPFRRTGLAGFLMNCMEETSSTLHDAYFVDLFVRKGNAVAQKLYERLGYVVYRAVTGYYQGSKNVPSEDALDLRKALPRNKTRSKSSVIPLGKAILPSELEWH
jgi:N-terminal acetyltransferase B complex catalytic subunit